MSIKIKYLLVSSLLTLLFFIWIFVSSKAIHDSKKCYQVYPLEREYKFLNKTHDFKISSKPFIKIESFVGNLKDGFSIDYEIDSEYNDKYIFITKYILNKKDGASFSYINNKISSIDVYSDNMKNGMAFKWDNLSRPSLLVVYLNDQAVGSISFWEDGRIRSIKFGSKYYNKSGTRHNETYDNGQKAFEYIEENGIKYWVVYNNDGQFLLKWPIDNDFCKAQFFEEGKKVQIPLAIDHNDFEEIYKKIKNDIN